MSTWRYKQPNKMKEVYTFLYSRMPTNKSRKKFKFTKSPVENPIVVIIITSTNAKTNM